MLDVLSAVSVHEQPMSHRGDIGRERASHREADRGREEEGLTEEVEKAEDDDERMSLLETETVKIPCDVWHCCQRAMLRCFIALLSIKLVVTATHVLFTFVLLYCVCTVTILIVEHSEFQYNLDNDKKRHRIENLIFGILQG